jgi:hypothetical protein
MWAPRGLISILFVVLFVPALPAGAQELELITDQNRKHYDGPGRNMAGGWGPHLRSILRSPGGDLWLVHDEATTIERNQKLRYRRRIGGQWIDAGFNDLPSPGGRVQQNMAHVMVGTVIYSYGVDVDRRHLLECTFQTLDATNKRCEEVLVHGQPLRLEPNSNYVGAAGSPDGFRLVWWSTVGPSEPTVGVGHLHHLWSFGSAWNGPVSTEVRVAGRDYTNVGYLRAVFSAPNRVELLGELENGDVDVVTHLTITIDNEYKPARLSLIGPPEQTIGAQDLWADPHGGLHAIVTVNVGSNVGRYFYKPLGKAWRLVRAFQGMTVARFQHEDCNAFLHLLSAESGRLLLRSGSVDGHSGPLDFDSFAPRSIEWPDSTDLSQPNGLYNMSRAYQTMDVRGLHFGLVGTARDFDQQIFHLGSP